MGEEYTKREKVTAAGYFIYQVASWPIRALFENFPYGLGAELLTPNRCLRRVSGKSLAEFIQK